MSGHSSAGWPTYGHPRLGHLLDACVLVWGVFADMVQPRVPQRIHLRGVELVVRSIVDPAMAQVKLLVVLVVFVPVPVCIKAAAAAAVELNDQFISPSLSAFRYVGVVRFVVF